MLLLVLLVFLISILICLTSVFSLSNRIICSK